MSHLVSVIIPNYNHAKYLKRRIRSVLDQTYQNIEVIILDDCSTDGSKSIIEEFRTHPKVVSIHYNEHNSGSTFRQWKQGLTIAKGDWIWIAESDDYCEPDFLMSMLAGEVNDGCGIRFCASISVDQDDVVVSMKQPTIDGGIYSGVEFLKKFQIVYNHVTNASAVLFKKQLLEDELNDGIGDYKILGDYLIYIRLMLKTGVFFSDEPRNYHRKHSQSVRAITEKDGTHHMEAKIFREEVKQLFSGLEDPILRKQLVKANSNAIWADEGFRAMQYVQNKEYWRSIPPLMKATFRPRFTFYYLKGFLYWVINSHN
jgi:glycosyltransferase involved in cell wall biosynthesis